MLMVHRISTHGQFLVNRERADQKLFGSLFFIKATSKKNGLTKKNNRDTFALSLEDTEFFDRKNKHGFQTWNYHEKQWLQRNR